MAGCSLYIMINIKASFQIYKKGALSNSSNFGHKVMKKNYLFVLFDDKKRKVRTRI